MSVLGKHAFWLISLAVLVCAVAWWLAKPAPSRRNELSSASHDLTIFADQRTLRAKQLLAWRSVNGEARQRDRRFPPGEDEYFSLIAIELALRASQGELFVRDGYEFSVYLPLSVGDDVYSYSAEIAAMDGARLAEWRLWSDFYVLGEPEQIDRRGGAHQLITGLEPGQQVLLSIYVTGLGKFAEAYDHAAKDQGLSQTEQTKLIVRLPVVVFSTEEIREQ